MRIYLITDTHFNHTNIIKYQHRPENFEKLIIKGLSILQPNDILIHLGDICLGKDAEVHSKIMPFLAHLHSKILVIGNHDHKCLSKNTRLLTKKGYKYYTELSEGESIPTVNLETGKVEFKPINNIYIYKNVPKLYVAKSRNVKIMEVTNYHVIINQLGSLKTTNKWKKQLAENLWNKKTAFKIPVAFSSDSRYNISDDYLKLIAWIMTDGSITKWNKIIIYQSKKNYVKEIKELLGRLNINFKESIRKSKVKYIFGKVIKSTLPAHEFYLDLNQSRVFLQKTELKSKYHIPDYMWHISDRQFNIFLIEMIKGDGTFRKEGTNGTLVLWGLYDFLLQIMGLCVTHNRSANICKHTSSNNYYLCIRKNKASKQFGTKQLSIEPYNDTAWCVNVENNVIFVELNNKTFVTGNSNTWYCQHGWDFVCKSFSAKYFGKNILFSHKPQIPESKYDINIHGHSHGNLHRADEYCEFWNLEYHKEFCLEHNHYQPILLETFLAKIKK